MLILGISVIVVLWLLGLPMFIAFASGSLILYLGYAQLPAMSIPQLIYNSVDKYVLTAIPFFILVGGLMEAGGTGEAYFRLVRAFVGHFRAGLAVAAILACMFFGFVCGSAVATAAAIGGLVAPQMLRSGYPREVVAAVCGAGGTLGIMIPPSIPMIILGDVTGVSIGALFIAGVIPGVMITIFMAIAVYFQCSRLKSIKLEPRSSWTERWRAFVYAIPALVMPIAILGSIYGGIATPTESAIVAVVACLIIGVVWYRKLTIRGFFESMKSTAATTAIIYCIIFGAVLFGQSLSFMKIPQIVTQAVMGSALTKMTFILIFIALFFVLGMIFDAMVMYYICLPVLLPAIRYFQIDLVPFCVLFVLVVMVGQVTPPVAITLYAAQASVKAETGKTIRAVMPALSAMVIATVFVAIWPGLSSFLPSLMQR